MRRVLLIAVLCTFVATPVLADFGHGAGYDGGTADWDREAGYYADQGGEFTIESSQEGDGLLLSNSAYATTTSNIGSTGSFQSFCLERGEYIYEPMRIWVSEASTGDLDTYGSGSHAWYGGEPGNGDDLDPRTAYLYTQFAQGTLLGYDYNAGSGREDSALQLQYAIWHIEGELTTNDTTALGWIQVAEDAIKDELWAGIGNVRVLQMYKEVHIPGVESSFTLKQDQLYLLTPEPGSLLLGSIGIGMVIARCRKRKTIIES